MRALFVNEYRWEKRVTGSKDDVRRAIVVVLVAGGSRMREKKGIDGVRISSHADWLNVDKRGPRPELLWGGRGDGGRWGDGEMG